jgi:23S rRNA-/tRNA-specific pseudouridylate synthase
VDEIELVIRNENLLIDILKHAHSKQNAMKAQSKLQGVRCSRENTNLNTVAVRGLRYSIPKDFTNVTHIKEQFVGHTLCSALAHMWRLQRGQQAIEEAELFWNNELLAGRVMLCGRRLKKTDPMPKWERVNGSTIVRSGDKVKVIGHRHERVIPQCSPVLLAESPVTSDAQSRFFVFDKPAGVPCCEDPDVSNSLRALASELVGERLHLAHRLDQCVTGCIVMASSAKAAGAARRLMQHTKDGTMGAGKYYIARVEGELPPELRDIASNDDSVPLPTEMQSDYTLEDLVGRPEINVRSIPIFATKTLIHVILSRPDYIFPIL